jgi:hypothetical protein
LPPLGQGGPPLGKLLLALCLGVGHRRSQPISPCARLGLAWASRECGDRPTARLPLFHEREQQGVPGPESRGGRHAPVRPRSRRVPFCIRVCLRGPSTNISCEPRGCFARIGEGQCRCGRVVQRASSSVVTVTRRTAGFARRCTSRRGRASDLGATRRGRQSLQRQAAASRQRCCSINPGASNRHGRVSNLGGSGSAALSRRRWVRAARSPAPSAAAVCSEPGTRARASGRSPRSPTAPSPREAQTSSRQSVRRLRAESRWLLERPGNASVGGARRDDWC